MFRGQHLGLNKESGCHGFLTSISNHRTGCCFLNERFSLKETYFWANLSHYQSDVSPKNAILNAIVFVYSVWTAIIGIV